MFRRITRGIFAGLSVACPGAGVKGRGELVEPDQGAAAAVADRGRAAEEDGPDRPGAEAEADRQLGGREVNVWRGPPVPRAPAVGPSPDGLDVVRACCILE